MTSWLDKIYEEDDPFDLSDEERDDTFTEKITKRLCRKLINNNAITQTFDKEYFYKIDEQKLKKIFKKMKCSIKFKHNEYREHCGGPPDCTCNYGSLIKECTMTVTKE